MKRIICLSCVLALLSMVCSDLIIGDDDDVCAKLFAQLAAEKRPEKPKKKIDEFTRAEINKITTERACLKHFPWTKDEFFVDDGNKTGVSVERMGEISSDIRQVCNRWAKNKVTTKEAIDATNDVQVKTLRMLKDGTDHEQLALYGEFFHLLKLRQSNKFSDIVKAVSGIKESDSLSVKLVQQDELEDNTYFTKNSLRCMIKLFGYDAAAREFSSQPSKLIPLTAQFLDDWPILQYHTKIAGDPYDGILTSIGVLRTEMMGRLKIEGEYWRHTGALNEISSLAGVTNNGKNLQLYLRATGNRIHAIDVSTAGRVRVLTPNEAAKIVSDVSRREMREASTDVMRLFRVLPEGNDYRIMFPNGNEVTVLASDYKLLDSGKKLPSDHPLSKELSSASEDCFALYAHPLMRKSGHEMKAANSLNFALQKAYPELRFHRDPISDQTSEKARALNEKTINSLEDLLVLVADDSFKVSQNTTVKNISRELTQLGIAPQVFSGKKYVGPKGRAVIVISGHTSEELAAYVRKLGDAGFFTDNFVVFNTCESQLTEQLTNEITSRYGAAAAFSFQEKIGIDEVQSYLISLVKKVATEKGLNLFKTLFDTLKRSKLNGIWDICRDDQRKLPNRYNQFMAINGSSQSGIGSIKISFNKP